jgi:hypothetical protein
MFSSFLSRARLAFLAAGAITALTGAVLAATPSAATPSAAAPSAATPSAGVEYPNYTHETARFPFAQTYYGGGYVDCAPGKLPIASGSANSDSRGMLLSSNTTTAGTGSFASGRSEGGPGHELEVRSHCVDAAKLRGFTRASLAYRDHSGNTWGNHVRKATCPEGTVAYGGGANVVANGVYDVAGLYTFGTRPDGRSWTYGGAGALSGRTLLVESKCLPRARLGKIVTVNDTVAGPGTAGRHRVIGSARCPEGYFAFAGGAFFHPSGSAAPSWSGYLQASMMSPDDRGWLVVGETFVPYAELTTRVRCTDRLG